MADFDGIVRVINTSSGQPTVELLGGDDEGGGSITGGGGGQTGDLVLRDESGRLRVFAHAGTQPFLRFESPTGSVTVLLNGNSGKLFTIGDLEAREADLTGRVVVRDSSSGQPAIELFGGDDKRGARITCRNNDDFELGTSGGIGVLGHSDQGVGVWGSVIHDGGKAGYFRGNVTVNGILIKAAGSFRIDHPLDPANKYLSHSFVESPDMMNIYNGNVVLDAEGRATIQLPAYFVALNKDFRYQLTAIGAPSPNLHVAEEIVDNRFAIAGGSADQKVSWQVTGIRQDAYAMAHRIPVEEDKPACEQGTYLTPKLFGQPETKAVDFAPISYLPSAT